MWIDIFLIYLQRKNKTLIINFIKKDYGKRWRFYKNS